MGSFQIDKEFKSFLLETSLSVGAEIFTPLAMVEKVKNIYNYVVINNVYYFIDKFKELSETGELEFHKNIEKRLNELAIDPEAENKRWLLALAKISDNEKIEYLVNLYYNLLTGKISYELFIGLFYFIDDATKFEISFAKSIYENKILENEFSWRYIKVLEKFGLIDITWGALDGQSTDPTQYNLNSYGRKAVESITGKIN